jgi:hypothetical protein
MGTDISTVLTDTVLYPAGQMEPQGLQKTYHGPKSHSENYILLMGDVFLVTSMLGDMPRDKKRRKSRDLMLHRNC